MHIGESCRDAKADHGHVVGMDTGGSGTVHAVGGDWRMYHCGSKGVQSRGDGLAPGVRPCEGPAGQRLPRRCFSCWPANV